MKELSYKAAPLGKQVAYLVDQVSIQEQGKPSSGMVFANVRRIEFVERAMRGTRTEIYRFITNSGPLNISITQLGTQTTRDDDYLNYQRVIVESLAAVLVHHPEMNVEITESKGFRLTIFALGLLSLLSSVGIMLAALFTNVSLDRWLAGALPMALLAMLGYHLIRGFHPWQDDVSVPLERLKLRLQHELSEAEK